MKPTAQRILDYLKETGKWESVLKLDKERRRFGGSALMRCLELWRLGLVEYKWVYKRGGSGNCGCHFRINKTGEKRRIVK